MTDIPTHFNNPYPHICYLVDQASRTRSVLNDIKKEMQKYPEAFPEKLISDIDKLRDLLDNLRAEGMLHATKHEQKIREHYEKTREIKNQDPSDFIFTEDGKKIENIIWRWTPPQKEFYEARLNNWDIAYEYAIQEVDDADFGIILWSRYDDGWCANPWSKRPVIVELMTRCANSGGSERNKVLDELEDILKNTKNYDGSNAEVFHITAILTDIKGLREMEDENGDNES